MPAAVSHYLLADRLLKKSEVDSAIASSNAFLWGAQGPDLFDCHRFLPWQKGESLKKYGQKLHETTPGTILELMQKYDQEKKKTEIHAYILGFISHFALDCTVHPFVQYSSAMLHPLLELSTLDTCHHTVESMLDVIFLRYERAALPTELNLKKLVPKDQSVKKDIANLYRSLFIDLYQEEIPCNLLEQCVEDCRTAFGWMTDRTSLKKQWIVRREKKKQRPPVISCHFRSMTEDDDFDYANILSGEWRWPLDSGPVRTDSFFQLVDQAEALSLRMIQRYLKGESLTSLTQGRSFL
ncbi:MAG: zinc dependent phospholipase C family protein [Clostridiales bacterium]|jgi:hypothetical protein|nr:zinc dependent phospholipase C family protein [Clostridiales bacterium]